MLSRLDARLRRLEAQTQATDDLPSAGLAALLAYVERHPIAETFNPESPLTGLALLLQEAQQALGKASPA
jgi:hypothetical protein